MSGITFENLCGNRIFFGCELSKEEINGEDCEICIFNLSGVSYKAIENPDDGYCSYCRELQISTKPLKYSFPGVEVFCHMMENSDSCKNNVLVIRDAKNGKVILEVGTTNIDDYYPYCHFRYIPENMSCNQGGNDV